MKKLNEYEFISTVAPMMRPVRKYLYAETRDYYLTGDLSQDTFEAAWECQDLLLQAENSEAYLIGIAKNKIDDYERRKLRNKSLLHKYKEHRSINEIDGDLDVVLDEAQRDDDRSALTKAVEELPEQLKNIILLHYMMDCTLMQTAIRQRLSYSTTRDKHRKALKLLKKSLERKGIHIDDVTLRSWLFMLYH